MQRLIVQCVFGRRRISAVVVALGNWTCLNAIAIAVAANPVSADAPRAAIEHFERAVRPLLSTRCIECHGPEEAESELRLDTAEGLFAGGHSGPVVIPHKPDDSRLIQLVRGTADLQMPPDDRLAPEEVAALDKWVRDGAIWPGYNAESLAKNSSTDSADAMFSDEQKSYWAFQPIQDPVPPPVADNSWPKAPIDHFILARLEAAGLQPSPPAGKRALLRRVTYGLTGLPPTVDEMAAFLADKSPDAFAKMVERLLASERYGEKWGQHWLDVVRFAESAGHDGNNAYVHAWRYRDYVVKSFNSDKPYDQFIVEQIAGDLLPKTDDAARNYDQIVATGFLQVGPKPVVMRDKQQMLLEIADEQVHTLGVAMLGLTLGCARCHDHKFDPIPTADYYSLAGIFTSTHVMADAAPDSKWWEPTIPTGDGGMADVMTVEDEPHPENLRIHLRGNYRTLGAEAPRRFLQIIAGAGHPPIEASGSGRLELARWIANPDHPLTARVIVNRIWQHHFGRGLVATSDNFGRVGERPTHPELLDWLATRFVESGWSIKAMHRLLLATRTYQQSCCEGPVAERIDPENRLLWRMPRRRLTAEEIRDSLLAVSGALDLSTSGTLFTDGYQPGDESRKLYVVDISSRDPFPPFESTRRSIYLPVLRNARPETLKLFDVANEQSSTSVRGETTVAPQALFLLNSTFVRQLSLQLAIRLLNEVRRPRTADVVDAAGLDAVVDGAYSMVFGRSPTQDEQVAVREFFNVYRSRLANVNLAPGEMAEFSQSAANQFESAIRQVRGLVGYYRFDGMEFDGASRSIRIDLPPRPMNTGEALTIELWMRPDDVRTATVAGCDGPSDRLWRIGIVADQAEGQPANRLFYEFYPPNSGGRIVTGKPVSVVPSGKWSHVVATYGNGKRRLFLNGQVIHEQEAAGVLRPFNVPLTIGARGDRNEWFRGGIDHVAVYDRALAPAEAQRHYRLFQECHWPADDLPHLLALRAFCQALICSNEFFHVE